ncbi:MAG TPA: 3-phosphoshikimate 1-carboxyvinyltransferase [Thermoanaerobaculaceae bacterium]|nr:3-phosphoshikimate 1-carboxyvinyltransferase [Thermoanaerobaculaceae bacterium]
MGGGDETVLTMPYSPGGVTGKVRVPPSKSLTQRALVAAALAGRGSVVRHPLDAEDPRLLAAALRGAGYGLEWGADSVTAHGRTPVRHGAFHLGNNGTGVRFMVAQLAALEGEWTVDGTERLRLRPIAPLVTALRQLGATVGPVHGGELALPLRVAGAALPGGEVALDASTSSQFVSALLLLGAALPDGVVVKLVSAPPSRPYLALTAEVLAAFGGRVTETAAGELESRGGGLVPAEFTVEGDWSAAAVPLAAAAVAGGRVEVAGVRPDSRQGDAAVLAILARAGCRVDATREGVALTGPASRPVAANLRDAPDLFPALAAVAAVSGGRLDGLQGLAAKESDRLAVMTRHLSALGYEAARGEGWFAAPGGVPRPATEVAPLDPAADHRIAMALAVVGCVVPGVRVSDPGCVAKSWPGFWVAWRSLVSGAS